MFGFSDAIQALMSILGVDVPPQLLNSVPYIVTIVVVAGLVGRVRGPAAAGQPYTQG
jgi:simple sugar transport system permease protein